MADEIIVPSEGAGWAEIWKFAVIYNGYARLGREESVRVGRTTWKRWLDERQLPDDLQTARAALFFEQRGSNHRAHDPDDLDKVVGNASVSAAAYVRSLVGTIRRLSGGTLPGPADPFP